MQVKFQPVTVTDFSSPNNNGTITATHTVTFPSNIISAGAALQEWFLSYGGTDHHVKSCGASVSNVSWNGPAVTFTVTLTLIDRNDNRISNSSSQAVVLVSACVE